MNYRFALRSLSIFLVSVSLLSPTLWAQGTRIAGINGAFGAAKGDLWAGYANPAGLAGTSAQGSAYSRQSYLAAELNTVAMAAAIPFKTTHVASFQVASFGFSAYRENALSLGYAGDFSGKISAGATLHYRQISLAELGSAGTVSVDAGVIAGLSQTLSIGGSIQNANRAALRTNATKQVLPTRLTLGVSYKPSDKVLFNTDLVQEIGFPFGFRTGMEYHIAKAMSVRFGGGIRPVTYSGGAGFHTGKWDFDLAYSFHERLGSSPQIGVSYRWK